MWYFRNSSGGGVVRSTASGGTVTPCGQWSERFGIEVVREKGWFRIASEMVVVGTYINGVAVGEGQHVGIEEGNGAVGEVLCCDRHMAR